MIVTGQVKACYVSQGRYSEQFLAPISASLGVISRAGGQKGQDDKRTNAWEERWFWGVCVLVPRRLGAGLKTHSCCFLLAVLRELDVTQSVDLDGRNTAGPWHALSCLDGSKEEHQHRKFPFAIKAVFCLCFLERSSWC